MFSHNFKVGGELHNFNEGLVIYLLSLYFVMEEDWEMERSVLMGQ